MGFAYLALTLNHRAGFLFHDSSPDVGQFLHSFQESHSPRSEINFSALYGGNDQFEVLHPMLSVQKMHFKDQGAACGGVDLEGRQKTGEACQMTAAANEVEFSDERSSKKRETLDQYLYEGIKLPAHFIDTPPFLDSRGFSYAYFLSRIDAVPYNEKSWVEQHLSLFKVSELSEILRKYHIVDPIYSLISQISESEMEEIIRGTSVVLSKDFLLIKNESQLGFSPLSYWVYDLSELQDSLKMGENELVPYRSDVLCLQHVGNACWTYSSRQAISYLYKYSLLILAIVGVVFLAFLSLYIKNLLERNREQQRQRLSLQVLSHEFRTPVSSLLLLAEQLSVRSQGLGEKDQDLVTRISSEAYKLQRIIEVSRTYLQATNGHIQMKMHEMPSINSWISDFAHELNPKIQCQPLDRDQGFKSDIFWLRFILSNLIQNAYLHGAEPVFLRLKCEHGVLKISVEDQGVSEFSSLKSMTEPFVKSSRSQGMGLGLNIVQFVMDECGYKLEFSQSPTSFTLTLGKAT